MQGVHGMFASQGRVYSHQSCAVVSSASTGRCRRGRMLGLVLRSTTSSPPSSWSSTTSLGPCRFSCCRSCLGVSVVWVSPPSGVGAESVSCRSWSSRSSRLLRCVAARALHCGSCLRSSRLSSGSGGPQLLRAFSSWPSSSSWFRSLF